MYSIIKISQTLLGFAVNVTWYSQLVITIAIGIYLDPSCVMLSFIVCCSLYRLLVAGILKLSFFFQLVLEHKEAIAPDHSDLLHELLKDLGEVPDVESLLGKIITNT